MIISFWDPVCYLFASWLFCGAVQKSPVVINNMI